MRIGISTSVIQRGQTGIGQYLFALLREFIARRENHQFILYVLEQDLPLFDFAKNHMQIVCVPERFRPPVKNILWHQTTLPRLARRDSLDVLHVPSYRRLLWPKPCPLVATIHDLAPFHVTGKYDWKRMLYGRIVVRQLAHRQDHVIAISRNTARDVATFFKVPPERISVVLNGLDHERFHPRDRDAARLVAAKKHGLHKPFFLYVARLEFPGKNHVRLIQAFNEFKRSTGSDWQLVLGGSDWHGAGQIHRAIKSSPVAGDIITLGFVSNEDLPGLYRAAETFVYPSLYEGFGMPPTEAMACGCPVISSTRGSLGEVVGEAAAIVDPENVFSISRQLTMVATDRSRRENLRRLGLDHARRFNWNRAAAETLRVYERAAAQSGNCLNVVPEMSHG